MFKKINARFKNSHSCEMFEICLLTSPIVINQYVHLYPLIYGSCAFKSHSFYGNSARFFQKSLHISKKPQNGKCSF